MGDGRIAIGAEEDEKKEKKKQKMGDTRVNWGVKGVYRYVCVNGCDVSKCVCVCVCMCGWVGSCGCVKRVCEACT
jgi:hypothetical protein